MFFQSAGAVEFCPLDVRIATYIGGELLKPIFEITGNTLSSCQTTPVAFPGCLQSFGALLIYDSETQEVLRVSENFQNFIPRGGARFSCSLGDWLPAEILSQVKSLEVGKMKTVVLNTSEFSDQPGVALWATLHRQGREIFLELERDPSGAAPVMSAERMSQLCVELSLLSEENFYTAVLDSIQSFMPFDRMMLYRFDEDWNGEVVAENLKADLQSYLHHWFPEGDIPLPAREMYLANPVRMIADISARTTPLQETNMHRPIKMVDLSPCVSRGVANVHVEYLRNMRVEASSSFAITIRGKLWGIVACHNRVPRYVNPETRSWVKVLLRLAGLKISEMEFLRDADELAFQRRIFEKIADRKTAGEEIPRLVNEAQEDFLRIVHADGFAIVNADSIHSVGKLPSEEWIRRFLEKAAQSGTAFRTQSMAEEIEDFKHSASDTAGMLAVRLSSNGGPWAVWFRNSIAKEVLWGGDPRKPPELESFTGRIHPRKSFETWKQSVFHRCAPWSDLEASVAKDLLRLLALEAN